MKITPIIDLINPNQIKEMARRKKKVLSTGCPGLKPEPAGTRPQTTLAIGLRHHGLF